MKATGIVRRVDELGRIVIPKEIRRTFRIKVGSPLEVFTDNNGGIMLKKYSVVNNVSEMAKSCADSLSETTGHLVMVSDEDKILAVAGGNKRDFLDKNIENIDTILNSNSLINAKRGDDNFTVVVDLEKERKYNHQLIVPINSLGNVAGVIVMMSEDSEFGELECKLIQTVARLLGNQADE